MKRIQKPMPGIPVTASDQEEALKKKKIKAPSQLTIGGKVGLKVWNKYVLPMIQNKEMSTRDIGELLGVSHMTVNRWRNAYL